MTNFIGQEVVLNGKTYKITGTNKRSFVLELDGKKYTATQDKINKIIALNNQAKVDFFYLEQRLRFKQIFNKQAKMPETEEEIFQEFISLTCELSGENLHCDGEASPAQVKKKLTIIKGTWAELEKKLGRKVSEAEVNEREMKEWSKK